MIENENKKEMSEVGNSEIVAEPKGPVGTLDPSLNLERYFTKHGGSPFEFGIYGNKLNWISEEVSVTDDKGQIIFTQPNVMKPDFWSSLALKVVSSKYFWGDQSKGEREDSIEKLVSRVSKYIGRQALEQNYFDGNQSDILRDEVASICLNQMCVFNSPVWFNCGIQDYDKNAGGVSSYVWDKNTDSIIRAKKTLDRPQGSACFIQSLSDDMESILNLQVSEATLFKAGSGTGTNRSALRSSKETLTGGGSASGPVSFMKGYDAYAGVIKSGGKTRRAAKMEILNIEHPDIMEFINSKQNEERKAWALIEQGYDGGMNGEAYGSIAFQNCNMSVRVSDEFMISAKNDGDWQTKFVKNGEVCETLKAKEILHKIAEGTHVCGDPGMQFDTIINKYHTCKNSGRINASNPCSEYMFIDDSACNLASINLMKFRTEDGKFDVDMFRNVVKTFVTSMDLIVDGASYPTESITRNSRDFRPLGLGYANLGALLMSFGLPYDSDEGRAVATAITAIMCGEAYKTSAKLAKMVGAFPRYEENKESMIEVMKMHRDNVKEIEVNKVPSNLRYLVNDAWDCWSSAVELGSEFGFRNSQTTVLAPTGTISFMMDCDTTGIEPDIALVKYKVLSGGGMLKIVNNSVSLALKNLKYSEEEIKKILDYINENGTIEGAPDLKEDHLSIFDCAFVAEKGKRSIHYKGHIKMMGVTQPFISGAISKTVNMPEHSTIDEIVDAYTFAWEQGLKAVAIYRENSKRSQPLNTVKTEGEIVQKEMKKAEYRTKLPQTRKSVTHKFDITGHEGYITVGLYEDGRPGELFVSMHKTGSTIRGLMDSWATSVSLNLQYGIPVDVLFAKFRHQKFEPAGFVKNENGGNLDSTPIRTASSIVDYVSQFMLNSFGKGSGKIQFEVKSLEKDHDEQKELKEFGNEGLICPLCGGNAKKLGNCSLVCKDCKQTTRSGCGE